MSKIEAKVWADVNPIREKAEKYLASTDCPRLTHMATEIRLVKDAITVELIRKNRRASRSEYGYHLCNYPTYSGIARGFIALCEKSSDGKILIGERDLDSLRFIERPFDSSYWERALKERLEKLRARLKEVMDLEAIEKEHKVSLVPYRECEEEEESFTAETMLGIFAIVCVAVMFAAFIAGFGS